MNNISRHIACKLCRDRKVRCDGGQPSCEKCRRSNETCVYVPTHKPTKADLAQTIESLQERLDKAEAYISRHSNTNRPTSSDQSVVGLNSTIGAEYTGCHPFVMPIRSTGPAGDQFIPAGLSGMPHTPYTHHSLPLAPDSSEQDFFNYLPSPNMTVRNEPSPFQVDEMRNLEDMPGSCTASLFRRESIYGHMHMPSLREVRAINSSSTSTTPPPSSPSCRSPRGEDVGKVLAELTSFGMAIFSTQAEIAGISSVVAEYLEWMRKASAAAAPGIFKPNLAVLEALETRVREIHHMATSRHLEAWRQSISMLERVDGVGSMLNLFDGEIQRRTAETAEFFQTSYQVSSALTEQPMLRKE
ncbi:hypothetical protein F5X99DRAFT_238582 [Biscogniauxia marginata]|nr:hypothetical protein F5X99DRAFT_238582 [Biscogniauxia marginata]